TVTGELSTNFAPPTVGPYTELAGTRKPITVPGVYLVTAGFDVTYAGAIPATAMAVAGTGNVMVFNVPGIGQITGPTLARATLPSFGVASFPDVGAGATAAGSAFWLTASSQGGGCTYFAGNTGYVATRIGSV